VILKKNRNILVVGNVKEISNTQKTKKVFADCKNKKYADKKK